MYVIDYALTPMETIDGPAPAGPVISGVVLAQLRDQSSLRARWMTEASAARDAALAEREQAQRDIDAQRDAWQERLRFRCGVFLDLRMENETVVTLAQLDVSCDRPFGRLDQKLKQSFAVRPMQTRGFSLSSAVLSRWIL